MSCAGDAAISRQSEPHRHTRTRERAVEMARGVRRLASKHQDAHRNLGGRVEPLAGHTGGARAFLPASQAPKQ